MENVNQHCLVLVKCRKDDQKIKNKRGRKSIKKKKKFWIVLQNWKNDMNCKKKKSYAKKK